jgi:hypothetical protein
MRSAALAILLLCVLAPSARADGLETLQDLAAFHLRPAPLVPTTAPRPLSDLVTTLTDARRIGKSGYGFRLVHYTSSGPDAIVVLTRGEHASMSAALRSFRRGGYKKRSTRIRGRRAYLLTRTREVLVAWNEDGRVYTIATGTPRKVPLSALRATAAGLDRLGSNYIGSSFQPGSDNTSFGAVLVATQQYVSGNVDFGTDTCTFNGFPAAAHGGSSTFMMVPLEGRDFSIPLHGPLVRPPGWNGTLSGAVSTAAITLTIQGAGTFDDGISCDLGTMSVSAPARDPI